MWVKLISQRPAKVMRFAMRIMEGNMFINFWYVASTSADLKAEAVKVKMLGQNFVLFRDSKGQAQCL
jgi:phenylpropionate dioxygenase-like ring-hydroxylating dioxygenase large terminal subunit